MKRRPEEFTAIWQHTHPINRKLIHGRRCVKVARKGKLPTFLPLQMLTSREFTDMIAYARTRAARYMRPYPE